MKKTKKLLAFLAVLTVGVGCFAFTACGDEDDNNDEGVNAGVTDGNGGNDNKDDYFSALVSEKVDEEGWKKAFAKEQYFNSTVMVDGCSNIQGTVYYETTYYYSEMKGNDRFIERLTLAGVEAGALSEQYAYYYVYYANSGIVETYSQSYDEETNEYSSDFNKYVFNPDDEGYEQMLVTFEAVHFMCTYGLEDFYSQFTYNDDLNAYEFKDGILEINKTWGSLGADAQLSYASVKIADGKLACLHVESSYEDYVSEFTCYYYDFGTTEVTLPEVAN